MVIPPDENTRPPLPPLARLEAGRCAWCLCPEPSLAREPVFPRALGGTLRLHVPGCSACRREPFPEGALAAGRLLGGRSLPDPAPGLRAAARIAYGLAWWSAGAPAMEGDPVRYVRLFAATGRGAPARWVGAPDASADLDEHVGVLVPDGVLFTGLVRLFGRVARVEMAAESRHWPEPVAAVCRRGEGERTLVGARADEIVRALRAAAGLP